MYKPIQKTEKTSVIQGGGYTKRQKAYTRIMNSDPVDLTLRCVNRQLVKLNYTQMIGFKKVYTVSPKRNIKLKRIPHQV